MKRRVSSGSVHPVRASLVRLLTAQAVGTLGDQAFLVTLSWILITRGSAAELAVVLAVWSVARGSSLFVGGAVVDRFPKRALAIGASLLMAGVTAYLGALAAAHDLHMVPWLAGALVLGCADGVRIPLAPSFLPYILEAEDLARGNRLMQTAGWVAHALGPAAGGVLVAWLGPDGVLALLAAWFGVTAALWAFVPPTVATSVAPLTSFLGSLREGVRFITAHPVLRWLLPVFTVDNFFVLGPVSVLVPVLVSRGLHGTSATLGLLNGVYGVGLLTGALGMPLWPRALRSSMRASLWIFAVSDGLFALLGLAKTSWSAAVLYGLCGLLIGPASILYRTYVMHITPRDYLGRVNGAARLTTYGLQPIAQMLAGLVATAVPVATLFAVAGSAALAADVAGCGLGQQTGPDVMAIPVET